MPQNLRLSASAFVGRGEKAREQSEIQAEDQKAVLKTKGNFQKRGNVGVGCVLDQIHVPGIGSRALISAVGPVGLQFSTPAHLLTEPRSWCSCVFTPQPGLAFDLRRLRPSQKVGTFERFEAGPEVSARRVVRCRAPRVVSPALRCRRILDKKDGILARPTVLKGDNPLGAGFFDVPLLITPPAHPSIFPRR